MARSIPALVKPALLVWARERSGVAIEEAAAKLKIETALLRAWENPDSEERPTIAQVRKLGEIYKRPLAVFFLQQPPTDFDAQREFRRLPGVTPQNESPEMRVALRVALFRREAARDLYEQLGEEIPVFDGKADPSEPSERVGARIRELLGIDWDTQLGWPTAYTALNAWRAAVENLGIFVFQSGEMTVHEMRGISIPHGPLPVILLNSGDAPHGRIFTLLHEFAHILLTNAGHETSSLEGQRKPEDQRLERISNRFAAAALLPRTQFLREVERYPAAARGDEEALRKLALRRLKVSPETILRRLVELGRTRVGTYRMMRREWQERSWYSPPQGEGGPPLEVRVIASAGKPFVSLVLDSYRRNAVSSSDVSDYLGMQLKYIGRLAKQLAPGPGPVELAV
jgi:Zn-dependent peptidase ImmA (M78 family)/transcriptional regulator with XRE-family HTH domain